MWGTAAIFPKNTSDEVAGKYTITLNEISVIKLGEIYLWPVGLFFGLRVGQQARVLVSSL